MDMLSTPLLDDAIKTSKRSGYFIDRNINLLERWQEAQDTLVEGLKSQKIHNVDFTNAKERISRMAEDVMATFTDPFFAELRKQRDGDNYQLRDRYMDAYVLVGHCQLNHAAGRIKRLEKKFMDLVGIPTYVEVLKEIRSMNEIVEALKPLIIKGRKPAENPTPFDPTNTATCAICANTQKLTAGKKMVHHGFIISISGQQLGYRQGSCFGVGYLPYEMSNEANVAYAVRLAEDLTNTQAYLGRLNAGEVTEFTDLAKRYERGRGYFTEAVTTKKGEDAFQYRLEREIRGTEFGIQSLESRIEYNNEKIAKWTRKPTYDEAKGTK